MLCSLCIITSLAKDDTYLSICSYITRITTENLVEVVHRVCMSLVELEVTHTYIEEFLCVLDALWIRIYRKKILRMRFAEVMLVWVVVDKKFAFCRIKAHKDLCRL